MSHEEWRAVPGFEGLYEVSDQGTVRSVDRVIERTGQGPARYKGRVLRAAKRAKGGYLSVHLSDHGRQKSYLVHDLVATAFIGQRPDGMWVAHRDGKPANNALQNLRYDTPSGNHADKLGHGTLLHSERHHNARLSRGDVACIRRRYTNERNIDLAAEYGVSPNHIYKIGSGKRWSHV